MPLMPNMTPEQESSYFKFWATVFEDLGFEPIFTKNPSSFLLIPRSSQGAQQVNDLRAIAKKYQTHADRLAAEIARTQVVVPESSNGDDDMLPPTLPPAAQRRQTR